MNASKARRRWLKWCRYVQKTQTQANGSRWRWTEIHAGQVKAFEDAMYAQRYFPKDARRIWYPRWGNAK